MKEKLVMIGNGMAGVRAIEELLKLAPEKYEITIFGSEPHANYNRILLSPVLTGEMALEDIMLNDVDWYKDNDINLQLNKKIVKIDRRGRKVMDEGGEETAYDRLLIATGSNPFIIPIPGHELEGVIAYRDIADVDYMLDTANEYKNAVVIGGGLLGLEAANGLKERGMNVTVVHLLDTLMERQLDASSGALLQSSLEDRGLSFKMTAQTAAIVGDKRVEKIQFADGSELATDLVVMAVGIRPNIELAEKAGIHSERGIVVNDTMQTYDPRIYAVGECLQHRGETYGLVAPLFEQAKVCANHLAELGHARYE
ncbi:MAG: NAD(P)/FAD-dependent oxidoreductase, partial [Thiotrichales bacterium]|nr:NAD(P)/FAD-dependent oxidoreductase [Thiotrichales bacterium]